MAVIHPEPDASAIGASNFPERDFGTALAVGAKFFRSRARLKEASANLVMLNKLQRGGIHAVTQIGRLGAIIENMAQVRLAFGTRNGVTTHPQAYVAAGADIFLGDRRPKTGPSRPRIEPRIGTE